MERREPRRHFETDAVVTAIILSKDRPAQLHLLLESIRRNAPEHISPVVIYKGNEQLYKNAAPDTLLIPETDFQKQVSREIQLGCRYICFMADDGILYRPYKGGAESALSADGSLLCVSLRLGFNTTVCHPTGLEQTPPRNDYFLWAEQQGDFSYPGSIDAHIFRRTDLLQMLDGRNFPNPTALECALVDACEKRKNQMPFMAMYPHSCYVGNPVNRTSEQSNVVYGLTHPTTISDALIWFDDGLRIDFDAMDFSNIQGAHHEVALKWTVKRSAG